MYSPSPIEIAPATRPAVPVSTMLRGATPPPPTPAIRAMLVTSPSIAPKTAGAQPAAGDVRVVCLAQCRRGLGHGRVRIS